MTTNEILAQLPYGKSFLFVDELLQIDENGAVGTFTYDKGLSFYESHFKNHPVTPAVILTETMAQIGLVCLGIYLLKDIDQDVSIAMTSNAIDFLKPVYPGEKVTVTSEKIYFRFNKLSCKVKMENTAGEVVCKGNISGMLISKNNG
ncbi:3-hydroxyacyl-ACP dehydratase FabZ family protein [Pedobacter sp. UBA5917]|jgi:3-hydroxyacyl-[acyl-carrier-protein] dehydratase|uniref:3-hydroxyacyl-ACP dehydratase FabZ family protein n=1 Tax=Pedobacter sp. UBA5917 TaxID=1947061 RepID=UPI0025EB570A|nr:hydroxymyristoyl-ACP dehydratase [Pedobacter sp. UBA5917]